MDEIELVASSSAKKAGDSIITTGIRRSLGGITISVHAHPKVEEFMKSLGSGEELDVRTLGRNWTSVSKDIPLLVYHIDNSMVQTSFPKFCLNRAGQDLQIMTSKARPRNLDDSPSPPPTPAEFITNLSFLRLKGISSETGVSFRYAQVLTPEGMIKLRDAITEAEDAFHKTFLKGITLSVQMISQDF